MLMIALGRTWTVAHAAHSFQITYTVAKEFVNLYDVGKILVNKLNYSGL